MIRFICKEVNLIHVIHVGGDPEVKHVTFDNEIATMENWLKFRDYENKNHEFLQRVFCGIEIID